MPRTAVIAGVGPGLGESLARKFAAEGCQVGLFARSADYLEERRDRLRERFADAQQDGITGVPTFAYDGHGARGAVPPEHLERLVEGT